MAEDDRCIGIFITSPATPRRLSFYLSSLPSVCRARSTSANGTKALRAEMDRGALILKLGLIDGGPVSHITLQVGLCSSLS